MIKLEIMNRKDFFRDNGEKGYRFLIGLNNYEDVWFDEELLKI